MTLNKILLHSGLVFMTLTLSITSIFILDITAINCIAGGILHSFENSLLDVLKVLVVPLACGDCSEIKPIKNAFNGIKNQILRIENPEAFEESLCCFHILGAVFRSHTNGSIQATVVSGSFSSQKTNVEVHLGVVKQRVFLKHCNFRILSHSR